MKRFTSIRQLDREYVLNILDDWEKGVVGAQDVREWAEEIFDGSFASGDFPASPDDPISVIFDVIFVLEKMYSDLVTKLDIPVLRNELNLGETDPRAAVDLAYDYWSGIDREKRFHFANASMKRWPERYPTLVSWLDDPCFES